MPLVVLCGLPAAGKSRVAAALAAHLEAAQGVAVRWITEQSVHVDKLRGYDDGRVEKTTRSALRAAVEHALSGDTIVLLDAPNYIKGVRYELYCRARAESTTYCVIYVDTPLSITLQRNATLDAPYDPSIIEAISARFEVPSEKNRWDSPLFRLTPESIEAEGIPLDAITDAIVHGKTVKAGLATKAAPTVEASFTQELDRVTSAIVDAVIAYQRDGNIADGMQVPQSTTSLRLTRKLTTAEVRRHRRQFVKISQLHPCAVSAIGNMFVEYLNTQA